MSINRIEDSTVKDTKATSVEIRDLKIATWLAVNHIRLSAITPIDRVRCSFTFIGNKGEIDKLMSAWAIGLPTADVREVLSEYQHLVHKSKDIIRAGGMQ